MRKSYQDYSFYKHYKFVFTAKPAWSLQSAFCKLELFGSHDAKTWIFLRKRFFPVTDTSIGRMYFIMLDKGHLMLCTKDNRVQAETITIESEGLSGYLWLSRILPNQNAKLIVWYSRAITRLRGMCKRLIFTSNLLPYTIGGIPKSFVNNPSLIDRGIIIDDFINKQTLLRKEGKLWE